MAGFELSTEAWRVDRRQDPFQEGPNSKKVNYPFPRRLAIDSKGIVWIGKYKAGTIDRFDPKTEKFTEYPLPNATHPTTPRFIWAADDGKIWFTEYWIGRIGYIDTGTGAKQVAAQ
jgi:streptogramin lyase